MNVPFEEALHPRGLGGQFVTSVKPAQARTLGGSDADRTRVTLLIGGRPHAYREPGGTITFADELPGMPQPETTELHVLATGTAGKGGSWTVRADVLSDDGKPVRTKDFHVTNEPGHLLVLEHDGSFLTISELDERGISLADCNGHDEKLLGLSPDGEESIYLDSVRTWLSDGGNPVEEVLAYSASGPGYMTGIDVTVYENMLWSDRFTEEELNEHADIVGDVYREWFGAELEDGDAWESVCVTFKSTIDNHRATPLLILEQAHNQYAKYLNETDPGTFGSPYVGTEIRRRIDERIADRERAAETEPAA